jgi:hypothetical protein
MAAIEEQLAGVRFPTHVGRVLEELQIAAISAKSPQAKGRVERGFGVLQDRLIAELQRHGLTDMGEAKVLVKQHLDGAWTVWYDGERIARHPATGLIEPIRSWKKRGKGRTAQQVHAASKPAFR